LYIIKSNFNTKDHGAPKSAGPVAIATFATIVNPALVYKIKYLWKSKKRFQRSMNAVMKSFFYP